ncbi:MAG: tyrosine-type recombinase/integrase [Veillonellaceae bacterium]|nr:tyrosine-type recombinase/integrase [Veillonellaceae bacterium]
MTLKVEKLIATWLKSFKSVCTVRNYQADLNQFAKWLKNKNILSAREQDIRNYLLDLEERELSKRTRNRRLATIKSLYNWLWENHHLKDNPAERIRLERLSENEKKVDPLDERVAVNLLSITKTDTMTGKRIYAILDLFVGAGLRREELVGLDLKDIYIPQTRVATITIRKGKGDKLRVIPLAGPQKDSLAAWLEVRSDYAAKIKTEAVFLTRLGTRPTGESIRQLVKTKLKQLGIDEKGIAVHSLRHLFASAYNAANQNDLVGLQAITGHANLSSLGIYTHPTLKRTQENLEKMVINKNR